MTSDPVAELLSRLLKPEEDPSRSPNPPPVAHPIIRTIVHCGLAPSRMTTVIIWAHIIIDYTFHT